LLALASLAGFALAYGWSSRRMHWSWSSLIGCATYLACTSLLQFLTVSLTWAFLLACGTLLIAVRALPTSVAARRASSTPAWDIPVRMALAALLVVVITTSSARLGPQMSGLLTPFPVAATILAAFSHHFEGSAAVAQFLRSLLMGLFSFAVFFLLIGVLVERWNIGATFTGATLGTLMFHAALWIRTGNHRVRLRVATEVPR